MFFKVYFKNIYLLIFVCLIVPGLSYGMWNLVPQPGIEPGPSAAALSDVRETEGDKWEGSEV